MWETKPVDGFISLSKDGDLWVRMSEVAAVRWSVRGSTVTLKNGLEYASADTPKTIIRSLTKEAGDD